MEARSRSSSGPVLPHTFTLKRIHSGAPRHFNSPSSSSGFVIHSTFSPTRATCASSYSSSASAAASSSINFSGQTSASQFRSPSRPISPKRGAPMKPIPYAQPRKTCMCSPTNHPAEYEKICHDEFAGKDRRCGRRLGEKSPHGSHTPIQPSHAKENVFRVPAN